MIHEMVAAELVPIIFFDWIVVNIKTYESKLYWNIGLLNDLAWHDWKTIHSNNANIDLSYKHVGLMTSLTDIVHYVLKY